VQRSRPRNLQPSRYRQVGVAGIAGQFTKLVATAHSGVGNPTSGCFQLNARLICKNASQFSFGLTL